MLAELVGAPVTWQAADLRGIVRAEDYSKTTEAMLVKATGNQHGSHRPQLEAPETGRTSQMPLTGILHHSSRAIGKLNSGFFNREQDMTVER